MPTAGLSHLPGVRIRDFFAVEKLTVQEEKRVAHCLPGPYREAIFRKPLREVAPLFTHVAINPHEYKWTTWDHPT